MSSFTGVITDKPSLGLFTFDIDTHLNVLMNVTGNCFFIFGRCLHTLAQAKRNSEAQEKQRLILKTVKRAISNQATRFSGYMQHVS